jgi:hypothetical protein
MTSTSEIRLGVVTAPSGVLEGSVFERRPGPEELVRVTDWNPSDE